MARTRIGFTLFEVTISLMLVTVAVITVLMLLPMGVKAQQMSRYQLYSSVKANEVVETFSQCIADFTHSNDKGTFMTWMGWDGWGWGEFYGIGNTEKTVYGCAGSFDLERIVINSYEGNYPIPLNIARRLDSAGDEIQKVLDVGGHIYYCDPFPGKAATRGFIALGAKADPSPELQRLVWAVTGYPQQNLLPMDPYEQPISEMWPFPPAGRDKPIPRYYAVGPRIRYNGLNGNPRWETIEGTACFPNQTFSPDANWNGAGSMYQANTWEGYAKWERDVKYGSVPTNQPQLIPGPPSYAQNNYITDPSLKLYQAAGIWDAGVHEFRRLSHQHYGRIMHQVRGYTERGVGLIEQVPDGYTLPFKFVSWRRLPGGTWEERWQYLDSSNPEKVVANRWDGPAWTEARMGIPAPANGLPNSIYRGTDIMNEDHETWNSHDRKDGENLHDQLRTGLPSLQRRVMYRTAALMLWAKVQSPAMASEPAGYRPPGFLPGPRYLNKAPADDLNWDIHVDPNVADEIDSITTVTMPGTTTQRMMGLPQDQNPLLKVIDPPNPYYIHASQVLALSYLAHAAMMVTGYQPPFVDNKWTHDPTDDVDLSIPPIAVDPDMPFRALRRRNPAGGDVTYLYDLWQNPLYPIPPDVVINPPAVLTLTNVVGHAYIDGHDYGLEVNPSARGRPTVYNPVTDTILGPATAQPDPAWDLPPLHGALESTDWTDPVTGLPSHRDRFEKDVDGNPITYERMTGPVLNPNPPPYADRGAFDYAGRTWTGIVGKPWQDDSTTPKTTFLRRWNGNGFLATSAPALAKPSGRAISDTQMAKNAHETFMRWAMAYISENPYDMIVPRPMNRQIVMDRPLFSFDIFDTNGDARRETGTALPANQGGKYSWGDQARYDQWYPTIWGGHRLMPNMYGQYMGTDDSYLEWLVERAAFLAWPLGTWSDRAGLANSSWGKTKDTTMYPSRSGVPLGQPNWPIEWGAPYYVNNVPQYDPSDMSKFPISHSDGVGRGIPGGGYFLTRYAPGLGQMNQGRQVVHGQTRYDLQGVGDKRTVSLISDLPMLPTGVPNPDNGWHHIRSSATPMKDRFWYTNPFRPADRCRQIVFWAVDWKAYEDSESAPSAPQEWTAHGRRYNLWNAVSALNGRVGGFSSLGRLIGNPEQDFVWMTPERDSTMNRPPDEAVSPPNAEWVGDTYDSRHPGVWYSRQPGWDALNVEKANPYYAVGLFGADRNHNGKWDKGPVPTTVRMRAAEVARYNYYDPIGWTTLRK
ncbi:MAG: hypothetical protein H0V44_09940 [Planctomycetes bacterium]|nr:hypothetical protein [Planctomycetota bacterium]